MSTLFNDGDALVQILSVGVVGLGFLLAALAFRLLRNEQKKKAPNAAVIRAIYVFMGFAVVLVVLGGYFNTAGENGPSTETPTNDDLIALRAVFATTAPGLVGDRSALQRRDGILSSGESVTVDVSLAPGECQTFLAMLLPGRRLEVQHRVGGVGESDVTVARSGSIDYQQRELCAGSRPGEIALTTVATERPSPYVTATYFSSRMSYDADGVPTGDMLVDVSQVTPVRPVGFEENQEFFVHVFSDATNRGDAARAVAILLENGFPTRPHIEDGANMVGWQQSGNGIVAGSGEGTQGKAVDIRRLLGPIISRERLEIYANGENNALLSMGGKALAVFLSGE